MRHFMLSRTVAVYLLLWGTTLASAVNIASPFDGQYTLASLGSPPDVQASLGGLVFKPGNPNILLIGGSANNANGKIYSVPLTRDASNHVTGFGTPTTVYAPAPNVDGGVFVGPDGNTILYTQYPTNHIGQIPPSFAANPSTDLTLLGVGASVGAGNFVPPSFSGGGRLKALSYNDGGFYDLSTPMFNPSTGLYSIASPATLTANVGSANGPEGFVYIKGGISPLIPNDSLLITLYTAGQVRLYDIDATGNPIVSSAQLFVDGLGGAEGAAIDPLTGDFFFCTFGGGNQVLRVSGFAAPPPDPTPTPPGVCEGSNCASVTVNAGCAAGRASTTKPCVSLAFSESAPTSTCA